MRFHGLLPCGECQSSKLLSLSLSLCLTGARVDAASDNGVTLGKIFSCLAQLTAESAFVSSSTPDWLAKSSFPRQIFRRRRQNVSKLRCLKLHSAAQHVLVSNFVAESRTTVMIFASVAFPRLRGAPLNFPWKFSIFSIFPFVASPRHSSCRLQHGAGNMYCLELSLHAQNGTRSPSSCARQHVKCTSLVKRHIMRKRGANCHRRVPGDRSFVTHTVEYLRVSRNKNSGLQSTQTHCQDKQLHTRARCKECTDAALTDALVRPTTATQIETHPEQETLTRRARYTMQVRNKARCLLRSRKHCVNIPHR